MEERRQAFARAREDSYASNCPVLHIIFTGDWAMFLLFRRLLRRFITLPGACALVVASQRLVRGWFDPSTELQTKIHV
jgi:hypothetical protein